MSGRSLDITIRLDHRQAQRAFSHLSDEADRLAKESDVAAQHLSKMLARIAKSGSLRGAPKEVRDYVNGIKIAVREADKIPNFIRSAGGTAELPRATALLEHYRSTMGNVATTSNATTNQVVSGQARQTEAIKKTARAQQNLMAEMTESRHQQMLGNMLHGLGNVRHFADILSDNLTGGLMAAKDATSKLENALIRIRSLLGDMGKGAAGESLVAGMRKSAEEISVTLGIPTLDVLQSQGDFLAMGMAPSMVPTATIGAMQLSKASFGETSPEDAAGLMNTASIALGTSLDKVADLLLTTANLSAFDMNQFSSMLASFGSAGSSMPGTSADEWLAMAKILRDAGANPRQVGFRLNQMSRGMNNSVSNLMGKPENMTPQFEKAATALNWTVNDFSETVNGVTQLRSAVEVYTNLAQKMAQFAKETGNSALAGQYANDIVGQSGVSAGLAMITQYSKRTGQSPSQLAEEIKLTADSGVSSGIIDQIKASLSVQESILQTMVDRVKIRMFKPIEEDYRGLLNVATEGLNAMERLVSEDSPMAAGMSKLVLGATMLSGALAVSLTVLTAIMSTILAGSGLSWFAGQTGVGSLKGNIGSLFISSAGELLALAKAPMFLATAFTVGFFLIRQAYTTNMAGLKDVLDKASVAFGQFMDVFIPLITGKGISKETWDLIPPDTQKKILGVLTAVTAVSRFIESASIPVMAAFKTTLQFVLDVLSNINDRLTGNAESLNKNHRSVLVNAKLLGHYAGVVLVAGTAFYLLKSAVSAVTGTFAILGKTIAFFATPFGMMLGLVLLGAFFYTKFKTSTSLLSKALYGLGISLVVLGITYRGYVLYTAVVTAMTVGYSKVLAGLAGNMVYLVARGMAVVAWGWIQATGMAVWTRVATGYAIALTGINVATLGIAGSAMLLVATFGLALEATLSLLDALSKLGGYDSYDSFLNDFMSTGGTLDQNGDPITDSSKLGMHKRNARESSAISREEYDNAVRVRTVRPNWAPEPTVSNGWSTPAPMQVNVEVNGVHTAADFADQVGNNVRRKIIDDLQNEGHLVGGGSW